MAFAGSDQLPLIVFWKTQCTERNALVDFHVFANHTRFANHDARTMIDEKVSPDLSTRMNINSRFTMGPFGHHSGQEWDLEFVELVSHPVDSDRHQSRVAKYDFEKVLTSRITVECGSDIGCQAGSYFGKTLQEFESQILSLFEQPVVTWQDGRLLNLGITVFRVGESPIQDQGLRYQTGQLLSDIL
jgi:hypothetical protein